MPNSEKPITRRLNKHDLGKSEDWVGNNAAFTCPDCGKVFLVSGITRKGGRPCPERGQSIGRVDEAAATASLESVK
jgi:predicted RNA-binding Zn-ribbon protein involved in translation (DUF1610 family)